MLFLIVLILNFSLFSMDRQESMATVESERRSPFAGDSQDSVQSETSGEDDLCDFAISKYISGIMGIDKYLKPSLKSILQNQPPLSPMLRYASSNAQVLRDVKKSRDQRAADDRSPLDENDQRVYDMIVRAMHKAIEEKEADLKEKERLIEIKETRIKEKYSGKKTASIAALTGTISVIITTICTTLVTLNSK